jgi:glycosyltransferase involved in cell wall biosynthesis
MGIHVRILAGQVGAGVGSHIYHRELACRLAARGHQVSVVCFASSPGVDDVAQVFEFAPRDYSNTRFFWRFTSLLQQRHFTREFMRVNIPPADVAIGGEHLFLRPHHRRFPQTPLIYMPHAPIAPKEVSRYDLPPAMSWVSTSLYGYLQRWGLKHADCTLRFTQVGCEILKSYYGDSIRVRFVVNPAGFELPPLRRERRMGDEVRLLSVGRLVPWKRIDLALSALAALRQYPWRFDVVGEGERRDELERQVRELGLEDRVRFHGYQADIGRWYEQADLFLFPSELEGLGFVMLEAMSYGVPCLAIRADWVNYWNANGEVITHGKDGLLTDGEDDYFRQLESVLRDPQPLIPLGIAARERVAERFTWDKHLDRYEELFSELIQERRFRNRGREPRKVSESREMKRMRFPVGSAPLQSLHHVLVSRELGGAGLIALGLAKALINRTGECHIWIPGDGPARSEAEKLQLRWHDYNLARLLSPSELHASIGNWQFYRACRASNPGIIHVHSPFVYGAIRASLKAARIKRVVHVQLEEDAAGLRWAFRQPPELIITCAKFMVDYVRQFLPRQCKETQRIVAVPNAVDTKRFFPGDKAEAKHRVGAVAGVPLILVLANLAPHKGQETTIRAVAELKNRGVDVACWLAGIERESGRDYITRLRSCISELGVGDRIRLLGFRSDTGDLLRAADFLLLPSSQEGLPICILEAQASKVPVLAAPTAGIPEVVSNGKTGFLIPAHDYIGYSNTVQTLIDNRRLYDEVSENAYEQMKREYEWKGYCERIWELYCDLLT